jgi:hypothetical protein
MSEILSLMTEQVPEESQEIGRLLSQGAAVGVLLGFHLPLFGMLADPANGYNFLLIAWLPFFLGGGIICGLFEATILWMCSYISGRRFHVVVRTVCATLLMAVVIFFFDALFVKEGNISGKDYLIFYGQFMAYGVIFGLVIGSRFRPWHELLRGTNPPQWPVPNGITGLLLRVLVVYALMVSVLLLIDLLNRTDHRKEVVLTIMAVTHCMAAAAILFARLPFRLLLPLALIINLPVVALITDVLTKDDELYRTFLLNYLVLWAAFVSCRFRFTSDQKEIER